MERLLTIAEAADALRTSTKFAQRLVSERKIRFVRVGRLVRIPESSLAEYVSSGAVDPITVTTTWRARRIGR
jgi:excisionase family DNA binding protein